MYLKDVYLCSTAWIEVMDLSAKCFVGDLTSLVRADIKINLEIITNSAGVFVFLVRTQKVFVRKVCKRQI
jgi:hypothetical protein